MNASDRPLIFRNRDFALLWAGQVFSQAGTRMYQIAILWWILTAGLGGGGKEVGLFLVISALPSILFVKIIGRTIDRFSSKSVLVVADIAAGLTIGIVTLTLFRSALTLPLAYVAGFLVALAQAFIDPTLNKAVPELVEGEDIEKGVAFQTSTQSLANFGGAVAGAALVGVIGIPTVALVNALSYFLSAGCAAVICFRFVQSKISIDEKGNEVAVDTQVSGWRVLDDLPIIRRLLVGFGLSNFFATPTIVILPLYTQRTLGASASVLGLLEASLWIGLIAGTFSSKHFNAEGRTIKLGAGCLFVFGFCLFLPGLIIQRYFYMGALFIAGAALGLCNVKFISLYQETVPAEIKGRFFALLQALVSFTIPIAYLLFGVLADIMPPPYVCLIQGAGVMVVAGYFLSMASLEGELRKEKEDANA